MEFKENSFDFLRLIFASFVIITHSYILSGRDECDLICQITSNQVKLSYIGVDGFFILSGFLIFQSLQRSRSIIVYFWKRILRIFPALFFVLLLTILFVPFIYTSQIPLKSNFSYWSYLPNNLTLFRAQYSIEGVFEKNPYSLVINGSLWTLSYEFLLYMLLSGLLFIKRKRLLVLSILLLVYLSSYTSSLFLSEGIKNKVLIFSNIKIGVLLSFISLFVGGAFLAAINIEKYIKKSIILLFLALLVLSFYFGLYIHVKQLILPTLVITIGLYPISFVNQFLKSIGDLSYGIYIYSFPIQQTLMYYFKFNYLELMLLSFVLSYGFAYLSWHLIEKKALLFKNLFVKNDKKISSTIFLNDNSN